MALRNVKMVYPVQPTLEGAGVRLHRGFGYKEVPLFDPFLLLDDFGSSNPDDYTAGFPWHPHRGIETVTYIIKGRVLHEDSMGNKGTIGNGDVQWMTAGSGIIHQEMPQRYDGAAKGFQLWVNLPGKHKMMDPRYQDIVSGTIPLVREKEGDVRVIAGNYHGIQGPVSDLMVDVFYLDVALAPGETFSYEVPSFFNVFLYIFEGKITVGDEHHPVGESIVVLTTTGDTVVVRSLDVSARFLLVGGKPLEEKIVWYGPMVMNTQEEIRHALDEFKKGTFIKHKTT